MILIDAPASALNNAGLEPGRMAENKVVVKKIKRGKDEFPYVSGQAFKRWWRETIHQKFGWKPSPIIREEKVAYTEANPITYEEDDVFGYMLAPKQRLKDAKMVAGLVYRRIAPLKCSALISVFPNVITDDFGVFSRGAEALAEPVPFEQEIYSTTLKGAFSLMLNEVGKFARGRATDLPKKGDAEQALKSKKGDISQFEQRLAQIEQDAKSKGATVRDDIIILPSNECKRRAKQAIQALSELSGGAKRSDYLTDVAPRFLIAAILNCANHIFMDTVKVVNGKISLNIDAVEEVVRDYHDRLLSPVFIGLRKGFFDDDEYQRIAKWAEKGIQFEVESEKGKGKKIEIKFGTPREAIDALSEMAIEHIK